MLSLLHPIQKSQTNTPHFMTTTQKNADTELAFNSDAIFYFDSVEGRSSFKSSIALCVVQTPTERHSLLFHPKAWFSTHVVDRLYEYVVYKRCVSRISCCLFLSAWFRGTSGSNDVKREVIRVPRIVLFVKVNPEEKIKHATLKKPHATPNCTSVMSFLWKIAAKHII